MLAGLLISNSATKVTLRTRVVSAGTGTSGLKSLVALYPEADGYPASYQPARTNLDASEDLGERAGSLRYATPWEDVELPISEPDAAQRVGFEVRTDGGCYWSTSKPAPVNAALLIDRIAVGS
jgi:hypothetical protein